MGRGRRRPGRVRLRGAARRCRRGRSRGGHGLCGTGQFLRRRTRCPALQTSDGASDCSRSANNYPGVVAREIGANLTDVSCSGATTAHVLRERQGTRPPQIEAVTSATRLVTLTIGGNDVNYLGSINAYSCQASGGTTCPTVNRDAIERTFPELPGRIADIVHAVRAARPRPASTWSPTSPCCRTPGMRRRAADRRTGGVRTGHRRAPGGRHRRRGRRDGGGPGRPGRGEPRP
ncbi:GDSL-type esterase/lipase family protein [Streptomyces tendae]|uniref:GDSL-type esterase/lipase family protein n=1 Tax=Streptomyces tendae TaxID=1932 RepID=UPI001F0D0793|nr:GDSL-type esterase/lipase family protein [Streptomyces tendae]